MTTPRTDEELIARLRKMAMCIYIAVEETVAADISDGLKQAADRLETLTAERDALAAALERLADVADHVSLAENIGTMDDAIIHARTTLNPEQTGEK